MRPALLVNGKIYTGSNHGEAFGKLTSEQQNGSITSGFINEEAQKFESVEINFYLKQVILIRHAMPESNTGNPKLCNKGRSQALRTSSYLSKQIDLKNYEGFCSPALRCLETSQILEKQTNIKFEVKEELSDAEDSFNSRLDLILEKIPSKCILITHSDFIINLSEAVSGLKVNFNVIPYCSITYIKESQVIWIAKNAEV